MLSLLLLASLRSPNTRQAMRASHQRHAPPLQPLPLPPPPLSLPSPPHTPRRGGRRRSCHSSSSSSSSSSSISSATTSTFFCPSPSPAPSPRTTTSFVPFSWERHPGVPKNSFRGGLAASPTAGTPLPLPPPALPRPGALRRRSRRAKAPAAASSSSDGARDDDPFVAAFAECTRDDDDGYATAADDGDDGANKLWPVLAKPALASSGRAERRWRIGGGGGGLAAFLDMYGCKSAMDVVADGAFFHPRRIVAAADPIRPVVVRRTPR